ncbi:MAG: nuclear transport factor 2 family protein [Chitinophagaceae bacterium]
MQRPLLSFLLLFCCYNAISQNNDIKVLTKLNQDWLNSYPTKDSATLAKIFADDFILISPNGTKMSKHDIINNLAKQEIVSVTIDTFDIRLLSKEVGLITAYTTFVFKTDGKDQVGHNCYQDVYVKRQKKWRAVAAHVTLLNKN